MLGLLLHSDASMQQLDIPVIVICNFFYKRIFIQNFWCLSFFPFCVLHFVRYNKTNMTSLCGVQQEYSSSRGLSPSGCTLGRQSSLGGVIPVVHHTGMSYLYNNCASSPRCQQDLVSDWKSRQKYDLHFLLLLYTSMLQADAGCKTQYG